MRYYPIYLNLQDRPCSVIGGGRIAGGKVRGLLEAEAVVTVISPELTADLKALTDERKIAHIARAYQPGDLAGATLVISATDDRAVNEQVWIEARARDIPINVVDDPPHCTFIAPSIVRRGDLAIAISTGGKAPALAVRLREQLEQSIGAEHARFLELAGQLREPLAARYPDFEQRKAVWYRLVDADVLDLLRRGEEDTARKRITEITGIALRDF
ncbi:MAG TPA: bifunctional precorrin-2 dehydrogenase/sirohydrochlorin ferrochelatase [Anaerolineae bacterium]|nr:bifunctional precorrin-2 dehydrogenase/sirohydrochlorin ferrochelatase [Anaerolineae bacterium]